ncbi:MAG: GIY-YIG nuclease family protein [Bacteroidetes bacterium]|nr:GIY-YIG nuclease family protein [Bacteroidota bacterium]
MIYTVYILWSESLRKYYTGQTQDLVRRLEEHNNGKTGSIRPGIPWKVVWSRNVETRSEAVKLEGRIKSRGAARFLREV